MAVATITERKEITGNLSFEIVLLEATTTETFKSKFSHIVAAFAQSESRAASRVSWSGNTVTYTCSGASDDPVCLFIVGY